MHSGSPNALLARLFVLPLGRVLQAHGAEVQVRMEHPIAVRAEEGATVPASELVHFHDSRPASGACVGAVAGHLELSELVQMNKASSNVCGRQQKQRTGQAVHGDGKHSDAASGTCQPAGPWPCRAIRAQFREVECGDVHVAVDESKRYHIEHLVRLRPLRGLDVGG